jgi:hypothetical protein
MVASITRIQRASQTLSEYLLLLFLYAWFSVLDMNDMNVVREGFTLIGIVVLR